MNRIERIINLCEDNFTRPLRCAGWVQEISDNWGLTERGIITIFSLACVVDLDQPSVDLRTYKAR